MPRTTATDLTDRAIAGGWTLPDGWTVNADVSPDYDNRPDGFDCYTDEQQAAWTRGDWQFVIVSVWVQDNAGREWGRSVLGGVKAGHLPMDDGATAWIDPLEDKPGKYSVIRKYDMIGEALREAVSELERFGAPVLSEPKGITVTGI